MEFTESSDLKKWKDDLARGSSLTSNVYFNNLKRFCISNNIQAGDLIKKDVKDLQDFIYDNVTRLEKEGKTGGYIEAILKAVKSWLNHNDIKLNRQVKIKDRNHTPTIENEKIPTQDELKGILNQAKVRGKAIIALMSQSGLRPQVMGDGEDGLRIGDLPELEVNFSSTIHYTLEGKYSFKKTPAMIKVKQSLSKTDNKYITFLSSEGCEYVIAHLQDRIINGEKLDSESPLIGYGQAGKNAYFKSDSTFLTQKTTMKDVRIALKKANYEARPYVFRDYFATQLLIAENKGLISSQYRKFFMGHKGDIEATYTINKVLTEDMINQMRKCYQASENFLMTTPRTNETLATTEAEIRVKVMREVVEKIVGPEMLEILLEQKRTELDHPPTLQEDYLSLLEIRQEQDDKRFIEIEKNLNRKHKQEFKELKKEIEEFKEKKEEPKTDDAIQGKIGDKILVIPSLKLQKFLSDYPEYEEKMSVNGSFFLVRLKTYK